jgi:hypothetical protein
MKINCPICGAQSNVSKEDIENIFTSDVVFKAVKSNRYLVKTWCEKSKAKPVVAVLAKLIQEEPHLEEEIMKGTIPNACCRDAISAEILEIKNQEKVEYDSDYYGYGWG